MASRFWYRIGPLIAYEWQVCYGPESGARNFMKDVTLSFGKGRGIDGAILRNRRSAKLSNMLQLV
ncbi:hypothetical protein ACVIKP_000525 [Rhizobium leguminosarum]